jgi:hypothetical protein
MPRRAYVHIGAIATLSVLGFGACLTLATRPVEWAWWGAAVLLLGMILGEYGAVEIARDTDQVGYTVSIATIPHLAAAMLLPPPLAALLAGTGMLVDQLRTRSSWPRALFNVASTTASVSLAALEANQLGIAGQQLGNGGWAHVLGFFGVAATYYAVNTLPVAGISTLLGGGAFSRIVVRNARFTAPAEFSLAVIGGLAGFVWVKDPHWLVACLFPSPSRSSPSAPSRRATAKPATSPPSSNWDVSCPTANPSRTPSAAPASGSAACTRWTGAFWIWTSRRCA